MAKPLAKLVALITPKRRWAQFSLATLLVVVTVLCVVLSMVIAPAERQRRAVAAVKALGGRIEYVKPVKGKSEAFPRRFLRRWLPRDYLDEVTIVNLSGTQVTDAGLAQIATLRNLQCLDLTETPITDAGIRYVIALARLKSLRINQTAVTETGLLELAVMGQLDDLSCDCALSEPGLRFLQRFAPAEISRLSLDNARCNDEALSQLEHFVALEQLDLAGNRLITDAGLAHIRPLQRLEWIDLGGTQITDAGLAHLAALPRLQSLTLAGTQVTGTGLASFARPAMLRSLSLSDTPTTDAGLEAVGRFSALDRLFLANTRVTDTGLAHLAPLTNLRQLSLASTVVTDAGLEHVGALKELWILVLNDTRATPVGIADLKRRLIPTCKVLP